MKKTKCGNKLQRTTTLHTRNIPVDLKAQFKAYCAKHGYTMEAAIIAMMQKIVTTKSSRLPEANRKRN